MRIEHLWQRMFRGGFYPAERLIGSALSGIDIALWDIKGQALGVPVYELLGGRCRDYVECFFQPGYLTTVVEHPRQQGAAEGNAYADLKEVAAAALRFVQEGYRYYRTSPNAIQGVFHATEAIERTLAELRAVREAVGDSLELMVDLHTRLDPPEAIRFCRECEPLNMFLVEDPIRSEHPGGYRHIRQHTNVPLAAGEQWANKWEFRTAIEEELIDYARIDLCIAGGLTEGKKIAAMAETHLIKLLLHNPLGPVCTAASLHLDLACDNAGPQEVLWPPQTMLPDVFECDFVLERGRLTTPTKPGLGVRFNKEAARAHPAEMTEPPHWRREDGSFTNY
jgi:galactonate dehydratase